MLVRETLLWLRHNSFSLDPKNGGRIIVHWAESSEVMVPGRHGLDFGSVR
jgi:hypothetical protein